MSAELTDGATYVEVLMLSHLDERERAMRIGRAMVTPVMAGESDLDELQRLRFYTTLVAFLLGVAENQLGTEGRDAIVQCMRNVASCAAMTRVGTMQ